MSFEATNQFFVWMLNQQDELRRAALKGDQNADTDQLPVFWIATVGSEAYVYLPLGPSPQDLRVQCKFDWVA